MYLKKGNGKLCYQYNINNKFNNRQNYFVDEISFEENTIIQDLEMEYVDYFIDDSFLKIKSSSSHVNNFLKQNKIKNNWVVLN